mgnify:FL=1
MILMMYFYKQLLKLFLNGNNSIYLIRVNVENLYSFNTNVIGYMKYMTLNSNILASLGYSFLYMLMEFANLFCFGIMFARTVIIGGLIIVSPFTAVYTMLGRAPTEGNNVRNAFTFGHFMRVYIVLLVLPLVMAGIQRIIMYIA